MDYLTPTYCSFVAMLSASAHRLSRFEGPNDVDFRSIMDTIKRVLIIRCSLIGTLAPSLADFIKDGFPVDLPDCRGLSALHHAVWSYNVDAVKRLTHQGNASVFKKDSLGQSPLHAAVQAARDVDGLLVKDGSGKEVDGRKIATQILNILLRKGARVDDKDEFGRTPWSYANTEGSDWIKRLRHNHLIVGSSSKPSRGMETVHPPPPGPQRGACDAFDMILAEVYVLRKGGRADDVFNIEMAPVYDVIYKPSSGVSHLLNESRSSKLTGHRLRCRWVHVPSNNEQWVYDLMLSMGIQDRSMGGQRHEGSRLIDRYLMPQARRYKYFHGQPISSQADAGPRMSWTGGSGIAQAAFLAPHDGADHPQRNPGPKSGKTGSAPESTMAEAEGVVIFVSRAAFNCCVDVAQAFLTLPSPDADFGLRNTSPAKIPRPIISQCQPGHAEGPCSMGD